MTVQTFTGIKLERPKDLHELGANLFILSEDYSIRWQGRNFIVPAGYLTDGASVPGAVPGGIADRVTGIEAAIAHDFMYETHTLSKEDADKLFDEMLEADPAVSDITRFLMVHALNSEAAERIYYGDDYVPEIVGQDDEIND